MEPTQLTFKKPPLVEARAEVAFKNTLEVADLKSRFYDVVKNDFPVIVMPEKIKLPYDFGDYSLNSENWAYRLEIGMNYFRLVNSSYLGFQLFKEQFSTSLLKFTQCYNIKSFLQFSMNYKNLLPQDRFEFEDCFSIKVTVAEDLKPLFAARGVMIFEHPEGHVSIEIAPQLDGNTITSYDLTLGFFLQQEFAYDESTNRMSVLLDTAHKCIEDYFQSLLTAKYLGYLKSR